MKALTLTFAGSFTLVQATCARWIHGNQVGGWGRIGALVHTYLLLTEVREAPYNHPKVVNRAQVINLHEKDILLHPTRTTAHFTFSNSSSEQSVKVSRPLEDTGGLLNTSVHSSPAPTSNPVGTEASSLQIPSVSDEAMLDIWQRVVTMKS